MKAVRAIVSGRVQGVGYRAWTVKTATKLGLKGWVRNVGNGTVEAVFAGSENMIALMLTSCRNGPVMARVDSIDVQPHTDMLPEEGFLTKPSV